MGCALYITNVYLTLKHLLLPHPISNMCTQFQCNCNVWEHTKLLSFFDNTVYININLTESILGRNLQYGAISSHIYLHNMNTWSSFPKLLFVVQFHSMNTFFKSQHFVISCTNNNFFLQMYLLCWQNLIHLSYFN